MLRWNYRFQIRVGVFNVDAVIGGSCYLKTFSYGQMAVFVEQEAAPMWTSGCWSKVLAERTELSAGKRPLAILNAMCPALARSL